MTKYTIEKSLYKSLPFTFRCRVHGKYDEEFYGTSPNDIDKDYTDLTDYDGFNYTTERKVLVNVSQVNNPTISDDGIVNDFAASKYVYCSDNTIVFTSPWRLFVKFTTSSSVSTNSNIIGCNVDTNGIRLGWGTDGLFFFLVSDSINGGWITTTGHKGTYVVQPNTTYWYVIGWDGTNYYGKYSLDGETYVDDISYASTTTPTYSTYPFRLGCNGASNAYPMTGSIDLKECKMETSSQFFPDAWNTVWSGIQSTQAVIYDFSNTILPWKWDYRDKLQTSRYVLDASNQTRTYYGNSINGTINGTLTTIRVYTPRISGFSSSNYLTALSEWNHGGTPWKIHLKVRSGASTSTDKYICGQPSTNYSTPQIALNGSTVKVWLSSNRSSWNIASGLSSSISLPPNETHTIDLEYTGENYLLSVDGTVGLTIANSTPDSYGNYPLILGFDKGNTAFNGDIYLDESYIEFNGEEVWRGVKKETVPSMSYGKTVGSTNNVYIINGNESLSAESTSITRTTNATNPRFLGTVARIQ